MTETAPPVPTPMTLEYLVEVFSNGYTKEQVEGFVESLGLEGCGEMVAAHAELRYNGIEFSEEERLEIEREPHPDDAELEIDSEVIRGWLKEQFGGAFTHEEAEAVVAGFDGDVKRASSLYKNLTDGYVSYMTVEDFIKAGKE
jgi:hypothetical protein